MNPGVHFLFSKKFEFIMLAFLVAIYLFLSMKDITLPGVNFDEAFPAAGTISLLKNKDIYYGFSSDSAFFGRRLPLMTGPYDSAIGSYLLLPFFFIFGINVFSLRMASISFGGVLLIFSYLFAKRLFDKKAAFITILLLATSPYFISLNKVGNFYLAYALVFPAIAVFYLLKWFKNGRILYFILAVFLLGLGLCALFSLGALIIAFIALFLIFLRDIDSSIKKSKIKVFWPYILWGGIFFCLGNFLYIYANLINESTRFITLKCIFERFLKTGQGVNNLDYLHNLGIRLKNLWDLLKETDTINRFGFSGKGNFVQPLLFFISFTWLLISLLFRQELYFRRKRVVFVFLLIAITFFISPFALSNFSPYHLIILIPYIQLTIAVGLVEFCYCFKGKLTNGISRCLVLSVLLLLVGSNLKILKESYVEMRRTGGQSVWSDAIYALADWLKEIKPSRIVALTWGFSRNLYFLFQGEMYIDDLHSTPDFKFKEEEFINNLKTFFNSQDAKYLVNIQWPDQRAYNLFKKTVNTVGKRLIEEKVFFQRDGRPVYAVYSVR